MSKKTSEVEEIVNIILELGWTSGRVTKDNFDKTKDYWTNKLLSWHTKQLAKEKMELVERIEGMWKNNPKPIKQEIWGGERGLGNTTVTSLDVFGQYRGDGYNQALRDILSALKSEEK